MLLEPTAVFDTLAKIHENRPDATAFQCDVTLSCDPQDGDEVETTVTVVYKVGAWPKKCHEEARESLEGLQ